MMSEKTGSLIKIFLFTTLLLHTGKANCYTRDKGTCCIGYYWNEKEQNCQECVLGYFGGNCSKHCRYPNYGNGCQSMCNCTEKLCHPAIGCVDAQGNMKTLGNKQVPLKTTSYRNFKRKELRNLTGLSKGTNGKIRGSTFNSNFIFIAVMGSLILLIIAIILKRVLKSKYKVKQEDKIHQLKNGVAALNSLFDNNRSCYSEQESNVYDTISENGLNCGCCRGKKYPSKCVSLF